MTAQQTQQSGDGPRPFGVWTQLRLQPARPRRRGSGWVATIAIAAVAFAAGGLVGLLLGSRGDTAPAPLAAASAPRPTPTAPRAIVPDRRVAGDGNPAITNDRLGRRIVRISVGAAQYLAGDQVVQPRRGRWAAFEVEVGALRDDVTTPDFYVQAGGDRYERSFRAPGDPAMLRPFTTLQKGERQAGTVAFDLPVRHGQLVVPGGDGKPQAIWTF